jgi:hypothetical protein
MLARAGKPASARPPHKQEDPRRALKVSLWRGRGESNPNDLVPRELASYVVAKQSQIVIAWHRIAQKRPGITAREQLVCQAFDGGDGDA